MAKPTPIITYKEILCRAIRNIEGEIEEMQKRCEGKTGDATIKEILDSYIAERTPKIEALKEMYRIETGTEY